MWTTRGNGGGMSPRCSFERLSAKLLGTDFDRVDQADGHLSGDGLLWAESLPDQRNFSVRRRYLPATCSARLGWAADRQAHLGRGRGHLRPGTAARWRRSVRARILHGRHRMASTDRRPWGRPGHRGRKRSRVDVIAGHDPQLERAIAEIEKALAGQSAYSAERPPDPDKAPKR